MESIPDFEIGFDIFPKEVGDSIYTSRIHDYIDGNITGTSASSGREVCLAFFTLEDLYEAKRYLLQNYGIFVLEERRKSSLSTHIIKKYCEELGIRFEIKYIYPESSRSTDRNRIWIQTYAENLEIKCKHFPWTCSEVPEEHSKGSLGFDGYGCPCIGNCPCDDFLPVSRSYYPEFKFEMKDCGGRHIDNCYWDCCFISNFPQRWVISPATSTSESATSESATSESATSESATSESASDSIHSM